MTFRRPVVQTLLKSMSKDVIRNVCWEHIGATFTHYKNIEKELGATCLTGSNGTYK